MVVASISLPVAPKRRKPRSSWLANFISKPASRHVIASYLAGRAITAARSARCPSAATSRAVLPISRCFRSGATSRPAFAGTVHSTRNSPIASWPAPTIWRTFSQPNDPASVTAFIFEPVVGATLGAAVPPDGYVERIAEICRSRGILLIADEVMTGMGRSGKPFAVEHWNVEPDLILVGKGIASGYAPLGAVLVSARVVEAFERGSGAFQHGFTYQAHPVSTAAGNAVLDYVESHKLFDRVAPAGASTARGARPTRRIILTSATSVVSDYSSASSS